MSMYFVVFHDGSFEYVTAYEYSLEHGHATFDKGNKQPAAEFYGVEYVQDKGLVA